MNGKPLVMRAMPDDAGPCHADGRIWDWTVVPATASVPVMIRHGSLVKCGMVLAMLAAAATSCRKPQQAVTSELKRAGYQITTEDWMKACRENDVPAMERFVKAGMDCKVVDDAGSSALHVAAAAGAEDAAGFLVKNGLDINLRGAGLRTPLMEAVLAGQAAMTRWLLRHDADPQLKDAEDLSPLMLAVQHDKPQVIRELAPYQRAGLDDALLLASLHGRTAAVDVLTQYGASVYARMDDGRTPLMLAAENGHIDTVRLLLDLGASRHELDQNNRNAAELAGAAGHDDVVAILAREPQPDELALETDTDIAAALQAAFNARIEPAAPSGPPDQPVRPRVPLPIDGQAIGKATAAAADGPPPGGVPAGGADAAKPAPAPPRELVMRQFRQRLMPLRVRGVTGQTIIFEVQGQTTREAHVRTGDIIPGTRLRVVRAKHLLTTSKANDGKPVDVSVVEVLDTASGARREWIAGMPATAHDPTALLEDTRSGRRYLATPGQKFRGPDGTEFTITDVRPDQWIVEDADGSTHTLPLHGPRG